MSRLTVSEAGARGGRATQASRTPEERTASARKAAEASAKARKPPMSRVWTLSPGLAVLLERNRGAWRYAWLTGCDDEHGDWRGPYTTERGARRAAERAIARVRR